MARHPRQGPIHTIIDAHNVIYANARLRRAMDEPEHARNELIDLLAGRPRIRIVCDGGPGGRHQVEIRHGITVEYAGTASADERIVAWLIAHSHLRSVVVTDDGDLAYRVRALGARVVACQTLLHGLSSKGIIAEDQRRLPPSAGEVDDWLRYFGLDGADIGE